MSKAKDRICEDCGVVTKTASRSLVCMSCHKERVRAQCIVDEEIQLKALGYFDISGPVYNEHGQRRWTFTHSCGTAQTWTYGNILKRIKVDPNTFPCSKCGGYRRMMFAHASYMKKNARTYDLAVYHDYARQVHIASDKVFLANQELLNPHGHVRSMNGWHLDHKVPTIVCFYEGLTPAQASRKENLELISAKANLSKGKFYFSWELLEELRSA